MCLKLRYEVEDLMGKKQTVDSERDNETSNVYRIKLVDTGCMSDNIEGSVW